MYACVCIYVYLYIYIHGEREVRPCILLNLSLVKILLDSPDPEGVFRSSGLNHEIHVIVQATGSLGEEEANFRSCGANY